MNPFRLFRAPLPRRWWIFLGILATAVACWIFLGSEDSEVAASSGTPVQEILTNGEHWVVFQIAPKRTVFVHGVIAVCKDYVLNPTVTRAEWYPDATLPLHQRLEHGDTKLLKVRRVGGGDWRLRIYYFAPPSRADLWRQRMKDMWRLRSLAPLNRTYFQPGQQFSASDFVKTTESVVEPPPPAKQPRTEEFPVSVFPTPVD